MEHTPHKLIDKPPSGAAMDEKIAPRRHRLRWAALALAVLACAGAYLGTRSHGLVVPAAELRVVAVRSGQFNDTLLARAKVSARLSVVLDATQAGRVEEIYARDGDQVAAGARLFRLSNPQRSLELLQRQSEHAQQISNLSNLRVAFEANRIAHRRQLTELEFNMAKARRTLTRQQELFNQGFSSQAALDDARDQMAEMSQSLGEEQAGRKVEAAVQANAIAQMEKAIARLESGLGLLNDTVAAMVVKAPVEGRLADFRLQLGESVKQDQALGRIDDTRQFKLVAEIDEFYLNRIAAGRIGTASMGGVEYGIAVSQIHSQIKGGRFSVELLFSKGQPPALTAGQAVDVTLVLGEPSPALLVENGPFMTDSGGAFIYVVAPDGRSALRRPVQWGRRNQSQLEVRDGLRAGEQVIVSGYERFRGAPALTLER